MTKGIFCIAYLAVVFVIANAQDRHGYSGSRRYGGVGDRPYNGYEEGGYDNIRNHELQCQYFCQLNICNHYKCFYTCRININCRTGGNVGIYGRAGNKDVIEITKPLSEKVDNFNYIPPSEETTPKEGAIIFQDD
ncbi:uncharacterized protein LOC143257582 [Tachypleus tridentatus]|uniref:uncharacterized protein LOC143257582 n=1 Tax=Tachypleus tridentatus TaxID=6853 RepID=UPI003FD25065